MEFREMGEKEYVIVSVGGWAVSYLVRGIQSTMYEVGNVPTRVDFRSELVGVGERAHLPM